MTSIERRLPGGKKLAGRESVWQNVIEASQAQTMVVTLANGFVENQMVL